MVNWSVGNERERGIEHPHLAPTPILRSTRCYSTQRLFHDCRHSTATLAGWLARRALAHPPVPYPSRPGRTDNIGDSKTKNPVGSIRYGGCQGELLGHRDPQIRNQRAKRIPGCAFIFAYHQPLCRRVLNEPTTKYFDTMIASGYHSIAVLTYPPRAALSSGGGGARLLSITTRRSVAAAAHCLLCCAV